MRPAYFQEARVGTPLAASDQRINVDQDHELTDWSWKLAVSRDRLREAVAKMGPMRRAVTDETTNRPFSVASSWQTHAPTFDYDSLRPRSRSVDCGMSCIAMTIE